MPRKRGDQRLARLRTLIERAAKQIGERAAQLAVAHTWLVEIARRLDPEAALETERRLSGAEVREKVETYLEQIATALANGEVPEWLYQPVEHLRTVLLRLGDGLYHCYDVPGLPRTDNALEQFYRRVKSGERRITGHRRSDNFVVRVGGYAVHAIAASGLSESELAKQLAGVPAAKWQAERAALRANQERQSRMRQFRLHREAYLADLEARWTELNRSP